MDKHSLHDGVLSRLAAALDDRGEYPHHPSDATLRGYVEGTLPGGSRHTPAISAAFAQGPLSDWRRTEVGLHVKTCNRCWPIVCKWRQASSEKAVEAAVNTNQLQRIFPWFQRGPRLVWSGLSYALVLLVGVGVGIWFNAQTQQDATLDDVSDIPPTLSSLPVDPETTLVDLLRKSGIDLSPFDLSQPLILYQVQAQDSLRSIAQTQWSDPKHWIMLYLLNYTVLKEMARPATDPLTLQTLRLPKLK